MISSTDRLLAQLNQTQLAQKDNPTYQVIKQLIGRIKELESSIGTTGTSTTVVNETINQINQFLNFEDSVNADDSAVFAGISSSGDSPVVVSDDYVVLSDGVIPTPSPVNDGAGNFIYVAYTP